MVPVHGPGPVGEPVSCKSAFFVGVAVYACTVQRNPCTVQSAPWAAAASVSAALVGSAASAASTSETITIRQSAPAPA
jgi:hypothetical protein